MTGRKITLAERMLCQDAEQEARDLAMLGERAAEAMDHESAVRSPAQWASLMEARVDTHPVPLSEMDRWSVAR